MLKKVFLILTLVVFTGASTLSSLDFSYAQVTSQEQRAELEAELAQLQVEITQKEIILKQQQQQTGTLKKDVNLLTSQIETAKLKIRQKTITINNLTNEIKAKIGVIDELQKEIIRSHDSLSQLLKNTNELDQKGTSYVLLSAQSVSDFYRDLDDFLSVKQSLYASVTKVKNIKSSTEIQKSQLQSKQAQEEDAKNSINSQKKIVEQSEAQKRQLLSISQNKEKEYQKVLAERQKKVAEIKAKLFNFAGGSAAIPFGQAYIYAQEASTKTGIRPAFLLAILTQESNLGKNVGTCNRAGDPPSKGWKNVMNPRDHAAFLRITTALGANPDVTPVSCPLPGGWGGAMGPAQFIPSTWEEVQGRVAELLGVPATNPWSPRDAIIASAVYLVKRGGTGGEANERNAACRYYSGRSCDGKKPTNSFYGNNVMAISRNIQLDIDYLVQYGVSRR